MSYRTRFRAAFTEIHGNAEIAEIAENQQPGISAITAISATAHIPQNLPIPTTDSSAADIADRARQGAEAYAAAEPDFEERVALIDRPDLPPEWAEGFAVINTMRKPVGYDYARWYLLIDDGGRFLDRWGTEAVRLGWDAISVFGIGTDAPEARHDLKGLIAALNGSEVVEIAADRAKVKTPRGSLLTYYRRPTQPGQAALWDRFDQEDT